MNLHPLGFIGRVLTGRSAGDVEATGAPHLERAVFDLMAGINPAAGTSADSAYAILFGLTYLSYLVAPIVLLLYVSAIVMAHRGRAP